MTNTTEPNIISEEYIPETSPEDIPAKKPRKKREPKLGGYDEKAEKKNNSEKGGKATNTTKKKRAQKKIPELTEEGIAKQILGIHMILALKFESARIEMDDALLIAGPAKEILDEYEMAWLAKFMPFISLLGALAIVELPVIIGIKEEIRKNRPVETQASESADGSSRPVAMVMVKKGE